MPREIRPSEARLLPTLPLSDHPQGLPLGDLRAGTLQVTLAQTPQEVEAAQALRYDVFVLERGAAASAEMQECARDFDDFDAHCDHLLVLEHASLGAPRVVGTYRLLRRSALSANDGPGAERFYTASEFDVSAVAAHPGEILELGRSCVAPEYRGRAVMQLLWRGIGAYVARHRIELMFGCASLHGTNPEAHAQALSYLHYFHEAPPELRLKALPERYTNMALLPREAVDAKRAFVALPALVKGYLRLGGYVGDGAVIDHEYNTIDVGVVVKTTLVTDKYVQRYGQKEGE